MIELFYMGGALFMGVLSLILLSVLVVATVLLMKIFKDHSTNSSNFEIIKSAGLFALVVGVLGQFIGLYSAFEAIDKMGGISQVLLVGGLKVSSITTIYGMIIFAVSYLLWFGLTAFSKKTSIDIS